MRFRVFGSARSPGPGTSLHVGASFPVTTGKVHPRRALFAAGVATTGLVLSACGTAATTPLPAAQPRTAATAVSAPVTKGYMDATGLYHAGSDIPHGFVSANGLYNPSREESFAAVVRGQVPANVLPAWSDGQWVVLAHTICDDFKQGVTEEQEMAVFVRTTGATYEAAQSVVNEANEAFCSSGH
jgi:hypothetical protein